PGRSVPRRARIAPGPVVPLWAGRRPGAALTPGFSFGMDLPPLRQLPQVLRQNGLIRFIEHFAELFPDAHLKDLVVDRIGPGRLIEVDGRAVVNFGSDSFLGLDQDPRIQEAVIRGTQKWGTHNGASRAFASVSANLLAEEKLASWLGTEAVLI